MFLIFSFCYTRIMEILLETLEETPWYVYLIFLYVIYTGVRALKSRTVPFQKVLILPLILTLWSFSNIFARWDYTFFPLALWFSFLLLGMGGGWWIVSFYKFRINHERGTISMPGSRWTLALILSLFAVRYCFGYLYATKSEAPPLFILIDFALSGLLIGVFIGRALHYWRIYKAPR